MRHLPTTDQQAWKVTNGAQARKIDSMTGEWAGERDGTGQHDLKSYLRILWRWKLLFVAILVLIPLGAYLLERGRPKLYQSTALIQPLNTAISPASSGGIGSAPANGSASVVNLMAAAQLVTTPTVAQIAAGNLQPPAGTGSLLHEVSATANTNTGFLTITAQDRDPDRAAAIANAFAAALSEHETRQATREINTQIRAFVKQLASTPSKDTAGQALLTQEIGTLRALRNSTGGGAQLIEAAVPSATPVSPNTRKAVEIGFAIALLLAIGAVFVAENGDRRLRTPEALEALIGAPVLGTVPRSAFSLSRRGTVKADEAFQMLRTALTYFNVHRPLSSVAIVSPGPEDGKTTVAVGLALAIAKAGSTVVLVDGDLRHAGVCDRLGIESSSGLSDVLAKERELSDVLLEVPIAAPDQGRLLVLPAGPAPPNPSALLSSQEMRHLLGRLEARADVVVLDTAAALAVGDVLPLLQRVSGVVMIVRMNRSSRVAVMKLQRVLSSAGSSVLGAVATASAPADGYKAYGYSSRARRKPRGSRRLFGFRRRQPTVPARLAESNGSAPTQSESSSSPSQAPTVSARSLDRPGF